jgi:hypothetical protein
MAARKQNEDRKRPGQEMPFKDTPQWLTSSRKALPSSFLHLSIVYSNFESISELNHCLGQSHHDLIWTYPEVVINLLGASQSNQVDNQDEPSHWVHSKHHRLYSHHLV